MNTVKNRIAEHLILDLDTPTPSVYNDYSKHDHSRHISVNITFGGGSNNVDGKGGTFGTIIGVVAIIWLISKAVPFLGSFSDFVTTWVM